MEPKFGNHSSKALLIKSKPREPEVRVRIEKTALAKELEEEFKESNDGQGMNFGIARHASYDAGFDVRACIEETVYLYPNNRVIISTGLHMELSHSNYEIQVRPRSGLAAKHGITVLNAPGTVDFGYRDEIKVILLNTSHELFEINTGDRIAQLCFRRVPSIEIEYVNEISRENDRGGGLGSSGVK